MKKILQNFTPPPRKCQANGVKRLARVTCFRNLLLSFLLTTLMEPAQSQTLMEVQLNPTLYNGAYHIRCNGGNDGEISTIVIGGEAPFSFLWNNGATTQDVDQLTAGTYTVTVTQNGGSTVSASVQLREPSALDPSLYSPTYAGGTNISINGGQDGSIQLTGQGGTPPYEYLWSNSSQEQDLYDLMAGTYTVTVTDANACTQTRSITLTEPTVLTITSITSPAFNGYNIHCRDGNDGSINLTVTGGVAPYEFQWNNGSFDEDPTGLTAGEYAIRVMDQNGTQAEASITLTQPDALSLELSPFVYPNNYHISLFGGYDGSIVTTAGGSVTPYSFLWNDGNTLQNRTTLNHGNKSLTLTDANGCELNAELLLLEPASADWMMGGNENTDPATQFIGTKDSVDLVMKTNNNERMKLKADGEIILSGLASISGYGLVYTDSTGALKAGHTLPVTPGAPFPWLISGNNNVVNGNFIGPTNGEDFVIKTSPGNGLQAFEHVRITNAGKIGIGTAAPQNKLDIYGAVVIGSGYAGTTVAPADGMLIEGKLLVGMPDLSSSSKFEVRNSGAVEMACVSTSVNTSRLWVKSQSGAYAFGVGADGIGRIYGNYGVPASLMAFRDDGKVGIGMLPPAATNDNINYKLYVEGSIAAREIKVTVQTFPDYVFKETYPLKSISELEEFIRVNKHLPGLPSADEVEKSKGIELGDMQLKLLEKIEEQSLYIIAQQQQIDELKLQVRNLEGRR